MEPEVVQMSIKTKRGKIVKMVKDGLDSDPDNPLVALSAQTLLQNSLLNTSPSDFNNKKAVLQELDDLNARILL